MAAAVNLSLASARIAATRRRARGPPASRRERPPRPEGLSGRRPEAIHTGRAAFPDAGPAKGKRMNASVFLTGMASGLSLIVAIGAQNAFVLRQGLRHEHVLAVCLICAASDAVLIAAGVAGFGQMMAAAPWLDPVMRYGGAAFLAAYGARSLVSALRATGALAVEGGSAPRSLLSVVLTCLAFTWLNPHVYLDTLGLLGALSTRFPGDEWSFGLGAISASGLFFFALGYGARRLRPVFARPSAWRMLEAVIAVVMWALAARLLLGG